MGNIWFTFGYNRTKFWVRDCDQCKTPHKRDDLTRHDGKLLCQDCLRTSESHQFEEWLK